MPVSSFFLISSSTDYLRDKTVPDPLLPIKSNWKPINMTMNTNFFKLIELSKLILFNDYQYIIDIY